MPPKISFVMPTRNRLEWIGESLQSLLSQTIVHDTEIIVVDDASDDGTKEFLDDWASKFPEVKIIRNEKQMGGGRSRNIGMEAASAPIIGVCDDDDINPVERAEITLKYFEEHPDSELVNFPNIQIGYCNERLEEFEGEPFDYEKFKNGQGVYFCNPSAAFKKKSAEEIGGYEPEFSNENVKETDDIQFLRKWVNAGKKVDFVPDYFMVYHRVLKDSMMAKIRGWQPKWATKAT